MVDTVELEIIYGSKSTLRFGVESRRVSTELFVNGHTIKRTVDHVLWEKAIDLIEPNPDVATLMSDLAIALSITPTITRKAN